MLASLFLLAIWLDASPPLKELTLTWAVLGSYFAFASIALAGAAGTTVEWETPKKGN